MYPWRHGRDTACVTCEKYCDGELCSSKLSVPNVARHFRLLIVNIRQIGFPRFFKITCNYIFICHKEISLTKCPLDHTHFSCPGNWACSFLLSGDECSWPKEHLQRATGSPSWASRTHQPARVMEHGGGEAHSGKLKGPGAQTKAVTLSLSAEWVQQIQQYSLSEKLDPWESRASIKKRNALYR